MELEDWIFYVRYWERKVNEELYKSKLNKINYIKWYYGIYFWLFFFVLLLLVDILNVGLIFIEFVCIWFFILFELINWFFFVIVWEYFICLII